MAVDKRYDLFGWDYPLINPLSAEEVAWYLGFARRAGGPLLELACGTGRLLARLAAEGFEATGLDLSETMLGLAREQVALLPADGQARATLVPADMSDFDLGRRFGVVYVADNSFRHLSARADMASCLRCVRGHLAEDAQARFLMAERRFDPSLYADGRREFGWSAPMTNPSTGELVRRRGETRLCDGGRRVRGEFVYEVTGADGTETVERCPIDGPLLRTEEYLGLFQEAGFRATAYADYTERPADGTEGMTCFVCAVA